jgi:hypothetical protein
MQERMRAYEAKEPKRVRRVPATSRRDTFTPPAHWERPRRVAGILGRTLTGDEAREVREFLKSQNPPPFKDKTLTPEKRNLIRIVGINLIVWMGVLYKIGPDLWHKISQ